MTQRTVFITGSSSGAIRQRFFGAENQEGA